MNEKPTYEDANLILRLYEDRREPKLREAREWFTHSFFAANLAEYQELCPPGSQANTYARMVIGYWEMVASFVAAGVLNRDLFFESGGEMLGVWIRIKGMLPEVRQAFGSQRIQKNLEIVANEYIDFLNRTSPGAYEGMEKMLSQRPPVRQARA
jgi:hypothetical protein